MSSNLTEFERFREEVLADLNLQEQLRRTPDKESFQKLLVALGGERGYRFTQADVEDALRTARRRWIERWLD